MVAVMFILMFGVFWGHMALLGFGAVLIGLLWLVENNSRG